MIIIVSCIAAITLLVVSLALIIKSTAGKCNSYLSEEAVPKWRFWLPGLCLSILSGILTYAIVFKVYTKSGVMGYALFFAVPVSFGAILGYTIKSIRLWWVVCLSLTAIMCITFAITSSGMAGIFCGLTLGGIFLPLLYLASLSDGF